MSTFQQENFRNNKSKNNVFKKRGSGILLHLTSLPSEYGIGDMGPWSLKFCNFLSKSGQSYWQILPLNPVDSVLGNSPYNSTSSFAGSTLFISPELLFHDGFLSREEITNIPKIPSRRVEYVKVTKYKTSLLEKAFQKFELERKRETKIYQGSEKQKIARESNDIIRCGEESSFDFKETAKFKEKSFEEFCIRNSDWLEDFSLFSVLKKRFSGKSWNRWPEEIKNRNPKVLKEIGKRYQEEIRFEKFSQYLFFKQWLYLKKYCNENNISIIGDIPLYVSYDSADVWSNPEVFKLDEQKIPKFVSGVPPDYFSPTGQLWGNPVYNWELLDKTGYRWWIRRLEHHLSLFDIVRIDHFRGLVAYWEVPWGEKTALHGKWVEAPAHNFFKRVFEHFGNLPIIAEDLGLITPEVKEVMSKFGIPGMKVLLFAFSEDNPSHPYLPHNYNKNCIVYTGTHDTNTVRGWFEKEASDNEKKRLFNYIGKRIKTKEIHWELIRLAMMSVATVAIFPMQDILGLGEKARMNKPATIGERNWTWRLCSSQLKEELAYKLGQVTKIYGR
ncbi:MAG: 4-alpha-glucanotransferase [Actinobacteria bacterium]|nr:4-alpha-glucanotransferase [Actinomycetota bacterium]